MRVESLDCNKCGAPLEVPEDVNFARCAHCGSRLKVHRESTVHYTEVLGKIERSTQRLEGEVRGLQLQLSMRDLDDRWKDEREKLVFRDQSGRTTVPRHSSAQAVYWMTGWIAAVGMVIGLVGGFALEMSCFMIGGIIVGVSIGAYLHSRAEAYATAERRYRTRREALQRQILQARMGARD